MAVPCFFILSGYLLFRNVEYLSLRLYCDKLHRRARTLLRPYLLWNLFVVLLYAIGQTLLPELFSGANTRIVDYSPKEWLQAFWVVDGTMSPINPPLWYIRDLMVMVLFSPLVYTLLRNKVIGGVFIALLLALSAVNISPIVWLQPRYIFFFSLGSWYGIHGAPQLQFKAWIALLGILLCSAGIAGFFVSGGAIRYAIYQATIIVGALTLIYLSHYLATTRGLRIPKMLDSSYFFIYLFHYIPLALIRKVLLLVVAPDTNTEYLMVYLGSFIAIVALSIGTSVLMQRLMPKTTAFILGNRI